MLDQDTAVALLTLADEHGWRLALLGDRHQLPAVGRGGVLEHAARWVDPITVDVIHRFVRRDDQRGSRVLPDGEYALLSGAMRVGEDPDAVFDALTARDQIRVHAGTAELHTAIAEAVLADRQARHETLVVAVTLEQVAALNTTIRGRLVTAGLVDNRHTISTLAGERLGRGDRVATRHNDVGLDVANRETWTVTAVRRDGSLTVRGRRGARQLPAHYVSEHLELAYAVTAHGAQGTTSATAHLLLDEHATAASTYVGMTRGRHANTAHLIATDLDQARDQWGLAFGRDRADLGPAAAREAAAHAAAGYTTGRPLADVLAELRAAWSQQLTAHWQLGHLQGQLGQLHAQAGWEARCGLVLDPLETARDAAQARLERAEQAATDSRDVLKERATQHGLALRHAWDAELVAADHAAETIAAGPSRLGIHRGRVRDAHEHLDRWEARWSEMLAGSELDPARLRYGPAVWRSSVEPVADALDQHAQRLAAAALPEHAARLRTAQHARDQYDTASSAYHDAWRELRGTSHLPVYDTGAAEQLPDLTEQVQAAQRRVSDLDQRVERLTRDPAITSLPDPQALLQRAETAWTLEQAAAYQQAVSREPSPFVSLSRDPYPAHEVEHGPSIGR